MKPLDNRGIPIWNAIGENDRTPCRWNRFGIKQIFHAVGDSVERAPHSVPENLLFSFPSLSEGKVRERGNNRIELRFELIHSGQVSPGQLNGRKVTSSDGE
jgi:hypothetical protein